MQLSDLLGIDRRGARFTRPLLIVVAGDGPLIGDMRQYAERGGARFELIGNARHAVFVDAPADFVALVRRFESTSSK